MFWNMICNIFKADGMTPLAWRSIIYEDVAIREQEREGVRNMRQIRRQRNQQVVDTYPDDERKMDVKGFIASPMVNATKKPENRYEASLGQYRERGTGGQNKEMTTRRISPKKVQMKPNKVQTQFWRGGASNKIKLSMEWLSIMIAGLMIGSWQWWLRRRAVTGKKATNPQVAGPGMKAKRLGMVLHGPPVFIWTAQAPNFLFPERHPATLPEVAAETGRSPASVQKAMQHIERAAEATRQGVPAKRQHQPFGEEGTIGISKAHWSNLAANPGLFLSLDGCIVSQPNAPIRAKRVALSWKRKLVRNVARDEVGTI